MAIGRCPFREKHHRHAILQGIAHADIRARGVGAVMALHEDRACPSCVAPEDRPVRNFGFGDEYAGQGSAINQDVEIAEVIAHDEPVRRKLPLDFKLHVDST